MPNTCKIANCRTGRKLTLKDKEKDCMECTDETCKCTKFECVCKATMCGCSCKVCKPKIFSFPDDPIELENWKRACPNSFSDEQKLMACEWHWPDGYDTVPPKKNPHLCSARPKDPPSIFKDIPKSFSRTGFTKPRPTLYASSDARSSVDELDEFENIDKIHTFEDFKHKAKSEINATNTTSHTFQYLVDGDCVYIYSGPIHKMDCCLLVNGDLSFHMYVRGVKIQNTLRIRLLKRMSQLSELLRQLKQTFLDIDENLKRFNDRQNELLVSCEKGRRFNVEDISHSLELICISRSAYIRLRSYLALPSVRTLQTYFNASESVGYDDLIKTLTPMQRYIHLNVDEIYIKPAIRFTGGQIYGYACDNPNELAKTVVVVMANCDYGGPKFVAALKPVYHLDAGFQQKIVLDVIQKIRKSGGHVFCCTFDGNAVNTRMVATMPNLIPYKPFITEHDGNPTFWLNDPIHLLKCIRNNFFVAKELEYVPPNSITTKTAKWEDLVDLFAYETNGSKIVKQSRLNKVSVDPPVIVRQRVDLAIRVFCCETASALQCFKREETAEFVSLVAIFFNIMNTKSPNASKRLKDPYRQPLTSNDSPALIFLKNFATMVSKMMPPLPKRKPSDKTLSKETAKAVVSAINGFSLMTEYLLGQGYSYVLLGRYTNDHIEKLFGKWRQASGANYYISVSDIIHTHRIQWSKVTTRFFGRLDNIKKQAQHHCDDCDKNPEEDILHLLKNDDTKCSEAVLGACVYIAGYLCHKFPYLPSQEYSELAAEEPKEIEFLRFIDRGGLKYPAPSILSFVCNCVAFFERFYDDSKRCRNYLMKCFQVIDELTDAQVGNDGPYRCLANILMNNYCRETTTNSNCLKRKIHKLTGSSN